MQFYILTDGKKSGPLTAYDLHGMVRSGEVTAETQAWYAGLDGWKPMGELPALESMFREAAPDAPEADADKEMEKDADAETDATEEMEPTTAAAAKKSALPRARDVRPWRRLFARLIDTQLFYIGVSLAQLKLGIIDSTQFYLPSMGALLSIYAMWIVIESLLLITFGNTPGKALLSLRIVTEDDSKMDFQRALRRSLSVWWRGFGIGFVPMQIFCGVLSYAGLKTLGTTAWDVGAGTRVRHAPLSMPRLFLFVLIFISLGHLLYATVGEPPFPLLPSREGGTDSPVVPEI